MKIMKIKESIKKNKNIFKMILKKRILNSINKLGLNSKILCITFKNIN